jgi:hypothetical protein
MERHRDQQIGFGFCCKSCKAFSGQQCQRAPQVKAVAVFKGVDQVAAAAVKEQGRPGRRVLQAGTAGVVIARTVKGTPTDAAAG